MATWLACGAALLLVFVQVEPRPADFRSIGENGAVLYDAPSARAKKLYVIGRSYPVEVIVVVEGWIKIRDAGGELAWIESRALSERRTGRVKTPLAAIRQGGNGH